MRKLMWFPIWKIDELENKLSEYEEEGYKVSEIKYSYFYLYFFFILATICSGLLSN